MKIAVFSTKPYDRQFLEEYNRNHHHEITFFEPRLTHETTTLASGFDAVCLFVNDVANAAVLHKLAAGGTRMIALRSAGYNHVDLETARHLGIAVARVPAYSPYAVAEHAL
ncbi:MAG TPA: 2-hydroxyacid dehydrogenase, partial [Roseiflexaceae bacterium]|nr:2-hydroxyacid dehydrogenase [Roseiflexaceae bacterium]